MPRPRLLATLLFAFLAAPPARDVDVGVPAGSPLEWTRAFPAYTPPREGLFPRTPEREEPVDPEKARTLSADSPERIDFRNADGFGLTRILTTDLPGHFSWMRPRADAAATGEGRLLPGPPAYGSGLYWVSLAPLLRWMLHPQLVPYESNLAHLVEIGEPVLSVLDDVQGERALRPAVADLRRLLAPEKAGAGTSRPIEAEGARDRMLARFTFEELLDRHAYDPEAAFAKRLLLFFEDTEPWVVRYAREGSPTVRRAAVAALGRYRSRRAVNVLLERAIFSRDPIETVRALAGLSNYHGPLDVTPLVHRLRSEPEPALRAALCGALGRPRAFEAIEPLLELVEQGLDRRESGVTIEALGALLRIGRHKETEPRLRAMIEKAERVLTSSGSTFATPSTNTQADARDDPQTRAEILLQLVRVLRHQLDPGAPETVERLVELADRPMPDAWQRHGSAVFGHVHAPARIAYLEGLARAGEEGVRRLTAIVRATELDPGLRGRALRRLPYPDRVDLATSLLGASHGDSMRVIAYETLVEDRHRDADAAGVALLREAAGARADRSPTRDHLYLRAVRTLSERNRVQVLELAPLVFHAERVSDALGDLAESITDRVDSLVERFLQGVTVNRIAPDVEALVDRVIETGINPSVDEESRGRVVEYVTNELRGLKSHRSDPTYVNAARRSIKTVLFGWKPEEFAGTERTARGSVGRFTTPVALGEEVLLALGRTRTETGARLLVDFLSNRRNKNRAAACLGLGMSGVREYTKTLASFLLDGDPFVRFCAYESLRHLTGLELEVDWMYGEAAERFDGAERFLARALTTEKEPDKR